MPYFMPTLDKLFSQDISKFTTAITPDVTATFPGSQRWASTFLLASTLKFDVPAERKPFFFAFLRRADSAFLEYDLFRSALAAYLADRKPSAYLHVLHRLEAALAMAYQAFEFVRAEFSTRESKWKHHEPGDGSPMARLCIIYNVSRHFTPKNLPTGQLHAISLKNDGIHVADANQSAHLSFVEFGEILSDIGEVANRWAAIGA